VIYYAGWVNHLAGVRDYQLWVSGDDVLLRMSKSDFAKFEATYPTVYWVKDPQKVQHGLGQLSKGLHITGDYASFLSKMIIATPEVVVSRLVHRTIGGSNYTHKDLEKPVHAAAVTLGMKEYARHNPYLRPYYKYRKARFLKRVTHKITTALKELQEDVPVQNQNHRDYMGWEPHMMAIYGGNAHAIAAQWQPEWATVARIWQTEGKDTHFEGGVGSDQ
jgi:hypothetical protein